MERSNPIQVGIEIPVDGYDAEPWNGITDYCLYRPNGEIIVVVEAKKQGRDPNVARAQTRRSTVMSMRSVQPYSHRIKGVTMPVCRGVGD